MFPLSLVLKKVIRSGTLTVLDPKDRASVYGQGTPHVTVKVHSRTTAWRIALDSARGGGEAYMDGRLTLEEGTPHQFLHLIGANFGAHRDFPKSWWWGKWQSWWNYLRTWNPIGKSQKDVAHHYDLSPEMYNLFLDQDRQYSCAYFAREDMDLDAAQYAKKVHIAGKLDLQPEHQVIEVGCGWGGLALTMNQLSGAAVRGITLSNEQLIAARARAEEAGVADKVTFAYEDYRQSTGQYDRVVSIAMFEQVGTPNYQAYFNQIANLMKDDGLALVHTIGRADPPADTDSWTRKYIFPGGYIPALSEMMSRIERAGLVVQDVESLRIHYAKTLDAWYDNFQAVRDKVAEIYDERFCRMWEFYLAGSAQAFRTGGLMIYQLQLGKTLDAAPITRDYLTDWDRRHIPGAGTLD